MVIFHSFLLTFTRGYQNLPDFFLRSHTARHEDASPMYFFQVWSLAVQVSQQDSSPAHWTTAMEHLDLRNVRLTGWGVGNWKRKSMLEAKLLFALFPNFGSRVQGSAGVGLRQRLWCPPASDRRWERALTEHVDPAIRQSFVAFCAEWKNQGFWRHLVWLRKTCSTTIAAWHSPR